MLPFVRLALLPEVLREAEVVSVLEEVLNELFIPFVERFFYGYGWSQPI